MLIGLFLGILLLPAVFLLLILWRLLDERDSLRYLWRFRRQL